MILSQQLKFPRCPHCYVASPNLIRVHTIDTTNADDNNARRWHIYKCTTCGGIVTAASLQKSNMMMECFPEPTMLDNALPERVRQFLQQAIDCIHAPAGSIMLSASAIDAMLKEKGYRQGNLYGRIDEAAANHLITTDVARWAHYVRLEANDQRHADDNAPLPTEQDAKKALEFAFGLSKILFELPALVEKGLKDSAPEEVLIT